jgi:hypothetical protein
VKFSAWLQFGTVAGENSKAMRAFLWLALALSVAFHGAARGDALLEVNGSPLKWPSSASDKPVIITFALLAGPYKIPNKGRALSPDNCSEMEAFETIVTSTPGLSAAAVRPELRKAFAAWEGAANIVFAEIADPGLADIVIGAQAFPTGRAFTNLTIRSGHRLIPVEKAIGMPHAEPKDQAGKDGASFASIEQSYVCLNPQMRWKIGFDGDLNAYDLLHTFMHEVGHAIGLDHPGGSGSVMAFRYDEQVRDLQSSDIAAVQRLYGPPQTAE